MTTLKTVDVSDNPQLRDAVRLLEQVLHHGEDRSQAVVIRDGATLFALLEVKPQAGDAKTADQPPTWPIDAEMLALSLNPTFAAMIEQARQQVREGKVVSAEELRRRRGITDEELAAVGRSRRTGARTPASRQNSDKG